MRRFLTYSIVWVLTIIYDAESCTLPVEWDGEWHDSSDTEQDITFTRSSSYVVGWKHTAYFDTITSWTCVDQDTSNNLLLFKSNQTVNIFGVLHRLYRCIKWEKLTDFSYSYLVHANKEPNVQNDRILVQTDSDSVDISSGCNPTNGLPTAVETIVLVKKAGSTASPENSSINTVLIAGIVVGVLVLAAGVAAVVGVVLCKKKSKVRTQSREIGSEHLG